MVNLYHALSVHAFCSVRHLHNAPGAVNETAAATRAGDWQSKEPTRSKIKAHSRKD